MSKNNLIKRLKALRGKPPKRCTGMLPSGEQCDHTAPTGYEMCFMCAGLKAKREEAERAHARQEYHDLSRRSGRQQTSTGS